MGDREVWHRGTGHPDAGRTPSHNSLCLPQGLLPRGQHPNPLREKNRRVNELVRAALAGHPRAHFLDADPGFVHSDGTISHHDMYDYLHLSRLGYTPVCRALHSLLLRLLTQDQGQGGAPLPEPSP